MPDRTVTVRLQLASEDFQNGMLQAGSSVRVLQEGLDSGGSSADDASDSLDSLATIAVGAGAGMTAAFTAVIAVGARFDQQMSATGAAAKASASELQQLRDAALEAGAATSFGATDAAAAEEELAKAGISVTDMVNGGLKGALSLAAAGSLDVADAAEIGATALSTFELNGSDMAHVADLLAAGAGKAQGSVDDLGMAMKQSALVSHQLGLSIDDQVGVLAEFASAGLIGSDAGTSLRTMMLRLNPASKEAAQTMEDLGIEAYDAQGRFVGMAKYAGILRDGLSNLSDEQRTQALTTIFGQDAIRAATVLYQGGAEGVREWTNAVNDQGYADDVASQKMDNLAGDIEKLKGAIETGLIQASKEGTGALRVLTQHLTNDIGALSSLPPVVSNVGTAMLGGTGAMLTFGGAALLLKGRMDAAAFSLMNIATTPGARFTRSLGAMSSGVSFLSRNLLGITAGVGIAAIAFDYWSQQQAKNNAQVATLAQTLDSATGSITEATRAVAQKALEDNGAAAAAERLGVSQATITDAALGQTDAVAQVAAAWKSFQDSVNNGTFEGSYKEQQKVGDDWLKLMSALQGGSKDIADAKAEWQRLNDAMAGNSQAAADAAAKQDAARTTLDGVTVSMQNQTDAATVLKGALDSLSGKAVSAEQANLTLQSGLNQLASTTKNNAEQHLAGAYSLTQIDAATGLYTAAVVQNRQALINAISQSNQHAQAVYDQTASIDQATAALSTDEAALRKAALAAGLNEAEVQKLIDTYAATPADVTTNVLANVDQAQSNIEQIHGQLLTLKDKTITITTIQKQYTYAATAKGADLQGSLPGRAGGGDVSAGSPYMVGEEGREIFVPATDGYIVDAQRTRSLLTPVPMAATGGGGAPSQGWASGPVEVNVIDRDGSFVARMRGEIRASRQAERLAGIGGRALGPT